MMDKKDIYQKFCVDLANLYLDELSGNGKDITNSILEEVTNFQVLEQKLK